MRKVGCWLKLPRTNLVQFNSFHQFTFCSQMVNIARLTLTALIRFWLFTATDHVNALDLQQIPSQMSLVHTTDTAHTIVGRTAVYVINDIIPGLHWNCQAVSGKMRLCCI